MIKWQYMLRSTLIFTVLLLTGRIVASPTNIVLHTTAEVRALGENEMRSSLPVELKGQIVARLFPGGLILRDSTGGFLIEDVHESRPALGDIVAIRGRTSIDESNRQESVRSNEVTFVEHRPPPSPRLTDAARISSGMDNFDLVRLRGFVSDIFRDENHADWNYMIVRHEGVPIYVSVPNTGATSVPFLELVDAEVEITGVGLPHYGADRMFVGPHLETWSKDCIKVIRPAPADPFTSPRLEDIFHVGPTEVAKMRRRLVEGRVLAVWSRNKLLLREDGGRMLEVELTGDQPLPKADMRIQAVGFPTTDLFRLNLHRALWKAVATTHTPQRDNAQNTSPADIFTDDLGRHVNAKGDRLLMQSFHGRLIRIHGIVRILPSPENTDVRMNLECDGYLVPVDLSANPSAADGLMIGCEIEATGVCVMETEKWSPSNLFPVFGGFTLVIRTPDDIRVLSRPSWWTPGRLLVVICSLFAALIAFFVWNRVLNRLVEKRGRQLFTEQIAHASEALKVGERTRLAVELHDSLSQNLAGLACQITAAKSAIPPNADAALHHLDTAERMLLSSRTELRRCLWDLRGNTLELDSMKEAIRKTILPVIGDAKLFLRFNVQRSRLLDSTAHSILCIIRELAANAIRHGQATQIRIAGEFHDDRLSFSVRDNGCGFDTTNYAGLAEGHFGLEGIKERVERLDGSFKISSVAKAGTRAEVSLPIPGNGEQSEIKS